MTDNRVQRHSYMPGLDGLRALAVLAVIGYHLDLPFMTGGFLGVTLFFVLSGFLITDILLSEWMQSSKINLKNFFVRRAKRLMPGVLFLLACVTVYVTLFQPSLITNLKSALVPAALFFSNWWYIFNETPYFGSFATPSLLNHFWSLAVEAQFYLVWPFLLIVAQRLIKKKWLRITLIAIAAVSSAVLMAVLFKPGFDPSRIYYGTDTRVFSLLIGACLAFLRPSRQIVKPLQTKGARIVSELTGLLSLATILLATYFVTEYDDFLYRGGMFLFSVASVLLIAAVANPSTIIGKIFSLRPLRYIGSISYGIYLWQFPVIVISSLMFPTSSLNITLCLAQVAVTLLAATVSYYLIEKPLRQSNLIDSPRKNIYMNFLHMRWWKKTSAILLITLILASGFGLPDAKPIAESGEDAQGASSPELPAPDAIIPSEAPGTSPQPDNVAATPTPSNDAAAQSPDTTPLEPAAIVKIDLPVTLIGDSIGLDVAPYLQALYPALNTEAEVGRQFYEAKNIVQQLLDTNQLASTVVIVLGSNGTVKESLMRAVIDMVGSERHIVFVNTQVPRSWCAGVNSTLKAVTAEYPNAIIADWYSASLGMSDYFYSDDVHPNKAGSQVMAQVIAEAIFDVLKPTATELAIAALPF